MASNPAAGPDGRGYSVYKLLLIGDAGKLLAFQLPTFTLNSV